MSEAYDAATEVKCGLHAVADAIEANLPSRRERIATAVLAGFAADIHVRATDRRPVEAAVQWADWLIEELDKKAVASDRQPE
jgi:hypothetical protein